MKITQRSTRQIRWKSMAAMALLGLAAIGGQRVAFAADAAITPSTVEVVPYQAGGYRYSVINYATQTTRPNVGFEQPEFNDSQWSSGGASMGSGGYCGLQSTRQSNWPVGTEIYVRRKVMIPAGATNIRIMAAADNDILAFFDGIALGPTITHEDCPVLDEFRLNVEPYAGTVEAGEHTLAFYIKDRGNQSFFDMRLLVDIVKAEATFTSGLVGYPDTTEKKLRMCAGAVADDDVHSGAAIVQVTRNGEPLAGATIEVSLDTTGINYSGTGIIAPKLLRAFNGTQIVLPNVTTGKVSITTPSNGEVTVRVSGSNLISQPRLVVKWNGAEIGTTKCDFAAAVTVRRFTPLNSDGDPIMPDEEGDSGWIFDFPNLVDPNNEEKITPAKIYRKFKRNPSRGDDYVDANGRGNWDFVNGHTMHIYVAGVKLYGSPDDATFYDGPEILDTPANLRQYAFIKDQRTSAESANLNTMDRETTSDGATPQVYVKAGPNIDNVAIIWADADDLTQREE